MSSEFIGKWVTSTNEENWSPAVGYDTKDEAIEHAPSDHDLAPGQRFYVGLAQDPGIPHIDPDYILEQAAEHLGDEVGEWAEGWPDATTAQIKELGEKLNAVFIAWLTEHKLEPTCFSIESVECHTVESAA